MESMPRALALGVGAPLIASLITLWLLWRRTEGDARRVHIATGIAFIVLFAGAWAAGFGMPQIPPVTGEGWLLPAALMGGVLGLLSLFMPARARPWILWPLRFSLLAGAGALIALNRIKGGWGVPDALPWIAGTAIGGLAMWWSFDRAGREPGGMAPALIVLGTVFASVVAVLTGHLKSAVTPATLCAIVGPALLVSFARPRLTLGPALGLGVAFLASNAFYTMVLGETPWLCNALVALGLVMVGVTSFGPFTRLRGAARWVVRGAMVALPGLIAVGWALATQPEPYTG